MTDEDILKCVQLFKLRVKYTEDRSKGIVYHLDETGVIQFGRCLLKYQHIKNPDPVKDFIKLLNEEHPDPMKELLSINEETKTSCVEVAPPTLNMNNVKRILKKLNKDVE